MVSIGDSFSIADLNFASPSYALYSADWGLQETKPLKEELPTKKMAATGLLSQETVAGEARIALIPWCRLY